MEGACDTCEARTNAETKKSAAQVVFLYVRANILGSSQAKRAQGPEIGCAGLAGTRLEGVERKKIRHHEQTVLCRQAPEDSQDRLSKDARESPCQQEGETALEVNLRVPNRQSLHQGF